MSNTYNIYKIRISCLDKLLEKIASVGLNKQKERNIDGYKMEFFYSKDLEGNKIWWWETYKEFFEEGLEEPKNKFHYGLMICTNVESPDLIFAITLGKSHFYVNKFIERDFGIELAIRIAKEETTLLKKSTYFSGAKRQEISSYTTFIKDSYEPGESVDHLKLKASDNELWGDKNIIFADSIQMDTEVTPAGLAKIFNQIIMALEKPQSIRLPKRERVYDDSLIADLDSILFEALKTMDASLMIEEFHVYGVNFCFSFTEYNYSIAYKKGKKSFYKKSLGGEIDIKTISEYLIENEDILNINDLHVSFEIEDKGGKFSKPLKEILDIYIQKDGVHYFLSNGDWCSFNQSFLDYLKESLIQIDFIQKEFLDENEYQAWAKDKKSKIDSGIPVENKIIYREYFFNQKQSADNGYELLDRELTMINSMESKKKTYKLEVADLYKDEEIIAVKISDKEKELIYNIEQSKDSLELILRKTIPCDKKISYACLWFVFEEKLERITEKNSIQFLLAIQSWKKLAEHFNITPKIYFSRHINK